MFGSGREALPDVREWSRLPPGCPGKVGRPSRMSGSVHEAHQDVRECSGGSPGCPGVIGIPSRMSASGREPTQMSRIGPEASSMSGSSR